MHDTRFQEFVVGREHMSLLGVLPRELLICAHRRLVPRELHLLDDSTGRARVELPLDCTARIAEQLRVYLSRLKVRYSGAHIRLPRGGGR